MKRSHQRVLDCLRSGGGAWWPGGYRQGWLTYPIEKWRTHGRAALVRASTLVEMQQLGLIELDTEGLPTSDTYARLLDVCVLPDWWWVNAHMSVDNG